MKIIAHCNEVFEAYLIKGVLDNNGIFSVILNENRGTYRYIPGVTIDVGVYEDDYDTALEIVKTIERNDAAT